MGVAEHQHPLRERAVRAVQVHGRLLRWGVYATTLALLLAAAPAWAAPTCSALASGTNTSTTDATSYNTASVTLVANRLYLAWIASEIGTGPPNSPGLTSTGATWGGLDTQIFQSAQLFRLTLLRTMVASNQTGAITIDFQGQTQTAASWSIVECSGTDTSGSNGSGAIVTTTKNSTNGLTSLTVTFASFASGDNRPVVGFANQASNPDVVSMDWTELAEITNGEGVLVATGWNNATSDTTVVHSSSGGASSWGGIGVEVKGATVASCAGRLALLGVGC